jgi:uncharacterized protein YndB with AHSA1/START domain
MKTFLRVIAGLVVLVLLAAVAAFFFPASYRVERTAEIAARPEQVLAHVADLREWKHWTAWHERDPNMKLSFSEKSTGVGAWSAWESESEGSGKMTITAVEPGRKVVYTLEFPDMHMVSSGEVALEPAGQGVRVRWVSEGELGLNPVNRWFGLFMERLIAPDFERGLAKLKALAEGAAAKKPQ